MVPNHSYYLNKVTTLARGMERVNKHIIANELDEAKVMMQRREQIRAESRTDL